MAIENCEYSAFKRKIVRIQELKECDTVFYAPCDAVFSNGK